MTVNSFSATIIAGLLCILPLYVGSTPPGYIVDHGQCSCVPYKTFCVQEVVELRVQSAFASRSLSCWYGARLCCDETSARSARTGRGHFVRGVVVRVPPSQRNSGASLPTLADIRGSSSNHQTTDREGNTSKENTRKIVSNLMKSSIEARNGSDTATENNINLVPIPGDTRREEPEINNSGDPVENHGQGVPIVSKYSATNSKSRIDAIKNIILDAQGKISNQTANTEEESKDGDGTANPEGMTSVSLIRESSVINNSENDVRSPEESNDGLSGGKIAIKKVKLDRHSEKQINKQDNVDEIKSSTCTDTEYECKSLHIDGSKDNVKTIVTLDSERISQKTSNEVLRLKLSSTSRNVTSYSSTAVVLEGIPSPLHTNVSLNIIETSVLAVASNIHTQVPTVSHQLDLDVGKPNSTINVHGSSNLTELSWLTTSKMPTLVPTVSSRLHLHEAKLNSTISVRTLIVVIKTTDLLSEALMQNSDIFDKYPSVSHTRSSKNLITLRSYILIPPNNVYSTQTSQISPVSSFTESIVEKSLQDSLLMFGVAEVYEEPEFLTPAFKTEDSDNEVHDSLIFMKTSYSSFVRPERPTSLTGDPMFSTLEILSTPISTTKTMMASFVKPITVETFSKSYRSSTPAPIFTPLFEDSDLTTRSTFIHLPLSPSVQDLKTIHVLFARTNTSWLMKSWRTEDIITQSIYDHLSSTLIETILEQHQADFGAKDLEYPKTHDAKQSHMVKQQSQTYEVLKKIQPSKVITRELVEGKSLLIHRITNEEEPSLKETQYIQSTAPVSAYTDIYSMLTRETHRLGKAKVIETDTLLSGNDKYMSHNKINLYTNIKSLAKVDSLSNSKSDVSGLFSQEGSYDKVHSLFEMDPLIRRTRENSTFSVQSTYTNTYVILQTVSEKKPAKFSEINEEYHKDTTKNVNRWKTYKGLTVPVDSTLITPTRVHTHTTRPSARATYTIESRITVQHAPPKSANSPGKHPHINIEELYIKPSYFSQEEFRAYLQSIREEVFNKTRKPVEEPGFWNWLFG